jgi:hypothetical protein
MVTVNGANLGPIVYVKVGRTRVMFYKSLSKTRLAIRVPKGAKTGKISVVTQLGAATSARSLVIG